jgi:DNA-binding transcriptional ArsR family regulator
MELFPVSSGRMPSNWTDIRGVCSCALQLEVLLVLAASEKRSGELAELLGREQSHVSHALHCLRAAGLVERERVSKFAPNRLTAAVRMKRSAAFWDITLTAADGSEMHLRLPASVLRDVLPATAMLECPPASATVVTAHHPADRAAEVPGRH